MCPRSLSRPPRTSRPNGSDWIYGSDWTDRSKRIARNCDEHRVYGDNRNNRTDRSVVYRSHGDNRNNRTHWTHGAYGCDRSSWI